jgi:transposase-like protein
MSAQLEAQPKVIRRTYSDMEKARALALYDMCGNLTETANKSGIPDSTLSQWIRAQTHANNKNLPKLRNEAGLSLADNFEQIAAEVASVALRKLRSKGADKIPFGQLMTGGGVAVTNSQLLRGLPTSINAEVERQELVVILQSALAAGLEGEAIDVTPEPDPRCITDGTV